MLMAIQVHIGNSGGIQPVHIGNSGGIQPVHIGISGGIQPVHQIPTLHMIADTASTIMSRANLIKYQSST
jgi:hypothetical protein